MGVATTTTGGTTVLEKVFYTSVLVSDQDKALDFYTNVLGLEKRVENPTGATSRSSTTPTATGCRSERVASRQSGNDLARRSRLALLRLEQQQRGAPGASGGRGRCVKRPLQRPITHLM